MNDKVYNYSLKDDPKAQIVPYVCLHNFELVTMAIFLHKF